MIFPSDEYICKWCGGLFKPYKTTAIVCSIGCAINLNTKKAEEKKAKSNEVDQKIKEWKPKVNANKNKKSLQMEVNKLARQIDARFEYLCIDCGGSYGKQVDGAHFHGVGSNNSIRYNLHNIHSAKSDCNFFSDTHKEGYRRGIVSRYGESYLAFIKNLPSQFTNVHLSYADVVEKLKIVRKINRSIQTYQLTDGISAREFFNQKIGIYGTINRNQTNY